MPPKLNTESTEYQFGRVIAKLESIEISINSQHSEVVGRLDKQDMRLGRLEKWKAWSTGALAAVTGFGALCLAWMQSHK
tara:strand:+ start:15570 stop:15806 length:237 start_codon:yes stop_codon:yes gene_type:complete